MLKEPLYNKAEVSQEAYTDQEIEVNALFFFLAATALALIVVTGISLLIWGVVSFIHQVLNS